MTETPTPAERAAFKRAEYARMVGLYRDLESIPDGDPIKEPPRTDPVPPEDEPADEPEGDD